MKENFPNIAKEIDIQVQEAGNGGKRTGIKKHNWALTGVRAQWTEHQPANQRVTGSIPSVGHMPGLGARSPVGGT